MTKTGFVLIATKDGHSVLRLEDIRAIHDTEGGGSTVVYIAHPSGGTTILKSVWSAERIARLIGEAERS